MPGRMGKRLPMTKGTNGIHKGKKREKGPPGVELEDDIDLFHKQRETRLAKKDKISLNLEDDTDEDAEEDEDDMEEPVFDIQGSDEIDEEEEDSEEEEDDEEELTGLQAKMEKQARLLQRKAAVMGLGAGEDDEDEEEGEEEEKATWGRGKRAYYDAEDVDGDGDEDEEGAAEEEEKEALRLQRKQMAGLRAADFGLDEEDDEEEAETLEEAVARGKKGSSKKGKAAKATATGGKGAVEVETIAKDVSALSTEEKMAALVSDAPELVGLLGELKEGLTELRTRVQPLLEKVRGGELATAEGLSYLEAKHLLLLSYCQCIVFYLMLKAEGRSVRDHPVIARLVEIRLFLEKIRPIDKKLQYQIEKLLKLAREGNVPGGAEAGDGEEGAAADGAMGLRAMPDMLLPKGDGAAEGDLYRPPKMVAASMEADEAGEGREGRNERRLRVKRARSSFVAELAAEMEGRPEEVRLGRDALESRDVTRERERLERRAEAEERLMTRVPLSKDERKRLKRMRRDQGNGLLGMIDDFDEEVAGLLDAEEEAKKEGQRPKRLAQAVAEAGRPKRPLPAAMNGDEDLPRREDLGARRQRHERQLLQHRMGADGGAGEDGEGEGERPEPVEDEFYQEARLAAERKRAAKEEKYTRPADGPVFEDATEGKRNISYNMEKNRGLTPHRNKDLKNPRKKYKLKYQGAVIRRKGQVQDMRSQAAPYGGEATGVKTGISRSVRFK